MRTINKIVITVIVAMLVLVFSGCEDDMDIEQVVRGVETPKEIVYTSAPTFDDLLDAIEQVESGGDPNAVGDNGKAIGAYQIHKIYVDDVNRILELNGWTIKSRTLDFPEELKWVTHGDRWDRDKSREMTRIYLANYCNAAVLGRTSTYEDMARIHNGGPDGWKKDSTKKYWEKVKAVLYE